MEQLLNDLKFSRCHCELCKHHSKNNKTPMHIMKVKKSEILVADLSISLIGSLVKKKRISASRQLGDSEQQKSIQASISFKLSMKESSKHHLSYVIETLALCGFLATYLSCY